MACFWTDIVMARQVCATAPTPAAGQIAGFCEGLRVQFQDWSAACELENETATASSVVVVAEYRQIGGNPAGDGEWRCGDVVGLGLHVRAPINPPVAMTRNEGAGVWADEAGDLDYSDTGSGEAEYSLLEVVIDGGPPTLWVVQHWSLG